MLKNITINWDLVAILIAAILIRIIGLSAVPPSMYGDELTITLDSYSLLKTGQDQLGNVLPITFEMGAGRPAGYVYGSIPFIALFGPTALGVRFLSFLSGIGLVVVIYLLTKKFFEQRIALIAAFLTSISLWDITLSRTGFEAHFALFLATLGILLTLSALKKPYLLIFAAICFGLTIHTYPTYKLLFIFFIPLLLFFVGIKKLLALNRVILLCAISILIIFVAESVYQTLYSSSEKRFSEINFLSQTELQNKTVEKINYERGIDALPSKYIPYFHNKVTENGSLLLSSYIANLSPNFLFLKGDENPRHNMALMGGFYVIEFLTILTGIIVLFKKESYKLRAFIVGWILISPLATTLLLVPHALRSSFMLPPFLMLSALGLYTLWNVEFFKTRILIKIFLVLCFGMQFIFFVDRYFFLSPNQYGDHWSLNAKLATEVINADKDQYKYIIVSDKISDIEYAYPVYSKVPPRDVITQNRNKSDLGDLKFKRFGNVYIGSLPTGEELKFINGLDGPALLITTPELKPQYIDYEIFHSPDQKPAFMVVEQE